MIEGVWIPLARVLAAAVVAAVRYSSWQGRAGAEGAVLRARQYQTHYYRSAGPAPAAEVSRG